MSCRLELTTFSAGTCALSVHDFRGTLLLHSAYPLPNLVVAGVAIDWLRTALGKDWLYRVGCVRGRTGPMFRLFAPQGIVLVSPTYSSSDVMEHAIATLKSLRHEAPVVMQPAFSRGRDISVTGSRSLWQRPSTGRSSVLNRRRAAVVPTP